MFHGLRRLTQYDPLCAIASLERSRLFTRCVHYFTVFLIKCSLCGCKRLCSKAIKNLSNGSVYSQICKQKMEMKSRSPVERARANPRPPIATPRLSLCTQGYTQPAFLPKMFDLRMQNSLIKKKESDGMFAQSVHLDSDARKEWDVSDM